MAPLRLLLSTLAAVSFVAFGSASHVPRNELELPVNPPHDNLIPLSAYGHGGVLTNAERMKRGLGLKKPVIGDRNVRRTDPSGTPTGPNEPEPTPPSSTCTGRTGYIRTNLREGASGDRWLSKSMNDFGEYGYTDTRSPDTALKVTLCGNEGEIFDILSHNSPAGSDIPYLGATTGYGSTSDELSSDSPNYAYLCATVQTPNGSPAVSGDNSFSRATQMPRNIESAIWSIDSNDKLSASWVNTDGSRVNTAILYSSSAAAFLITAGPQAHRGEYGQAPEYLFTFDEDVVY